MSTYTAPSGPGYDYPREEDDEQDTCEDCRRPLYRCRCHRRPETEPDNAAAEIASREYEARLFREPGETDL